MEKNVQSNANWQQFVPKGPGTRGIPAPDDSFFKTADLHVPEKQTITIRLDTDVLDWFRRQGRGYQTRINKLLRSYMQAQD
jgi:uncharacterized protein (DUF4415 family)